MCGIVGQIGAQNVEPFLIDGLKRLEYRGYDSYGYLIVDKQGKWHSHKKAGESVKDHKPLNINGAIGIGHTRWATHGSPSPANTHPILCGMKIEENYFYKHLTNQQSLYQYNPPPNISEPTIAIVHNGNVDNYQELRSNLNLMYKFNTDTDTEAIGHYIDFLLRYRLPTEYNDDKIFEILKPVFKNIKGTFAIAFVSTYTPNKLVAMVKGSPLVYTSFGHIASDINTLSGYASIAWRLQDGDILVMDKMYGRVENVDSEINNKIRFTERDCEKIPDIKYEEVVGDYMYKEIKEQTDLITQPLKPAFPPRPSKVFIFGCGSSWHAGLIGKHYFEELSDIPTEVEYASEALDRQLHIQPKDTLFIGITQSGETKDTLDVIKKLHILKRKVMVIHNSDGSQADNLADYVINIKAGLEVGVAATKTFTQQIKALWEQALWFSPQQTQDIYKSFKNYWVDLASLTESIFAKEEELKSLAKDVTKFNHCLYLAKGINYPVALEGALKMKEIAYLHAEAMPAAELKHGPLALIDNKTLTLFLCSFSNANNPEAILHNMSEVKSRGGIILSICDHLSWGWANKYTDYSFIIPATSQKLQPILFNIPLQLLAYYVAKERGYNVDKPRNLAKSVTV